MVRRTLDAALLLLVGALLAAALAFALKAGGVDSQPRAPEHLITAEGTARSLAPGLAALDTKQRGPLQTMGGNFL